jgi:Ca2+-binding EF-hand superfamily protein
LQPSDEEQFGRRHSDEVMGRRRSRIGADLDIPAQVNVGRRRSLPFADPGNDAAAAAAAAAAAGKDPDEFEWEFNSSKVGSVTVKGNSTLDMLSGFRNRVEERRRSTYSLLTTKPKKMRQATKDEWQVAQHLWKWCTETFGNLDLAFEVLDVSKTQRLSSVEFADRLRASKYPGNETTYKKLFILFSQDGLIGKDEFVGKYLKAPSSPQQHKSPSSEVERRPSIQYDPIKDMMQKHGLIRAKSIIETKRDSVCQELHKQDTVVGQFIQHLYISYMSLREAFQKIDITGTGSLTKSEFKDGLRVLKVGNQSLLDMHTEDLFDRCDRYLKGRITIEGILEESEKDPVVKRFLKYLCDPRKDNHGEQNGKKIEKDAYSQQHDRLVRIFQIMHNPGKEIEKQEFLQALQRNKYPDWHAGDLFTRLNRDGTGKMTAAEFVVHLENTDAFRTPEPSTPQPRRRSMPELGQPPMPRRPSTSVTEGTTVSTVNGQVGDQMLVKHDSLGLVKVLGDGSQVDKLKEFSDRVQEQGRRRSIVGGPRRGSI